MLTSVPSAVPPPASFHHREFDADELAALKGDAIVSVCIPARDEAATVGDIVAAIRSDLVNRSGLVDEVIVIDDHSSDRTAHVAAHAGARVLDASQPLVEHGTGPGKGEALWRSVSEAHGDLITWCDADIEDFGPRFIVGVLGPLITRPEIGFVKGCYERPVTAGGGGRVTELVARPLLSTYFPELTGIAQPLSGEYGGRREVLEAVPFARGYGVDVGLVIDIAAQFGLEAVAQVDLDVRRHRHRPLTELGPQAMAVAHAILSRVDANTDEMANTLFVPGRAPTEVDASDQPPLTSLASGAEHSA